MMKRRFTSFFSYFFSPSLFLALFLGTAFGAATLISVSASAQVRQIQASEGRSNYRIASDGSLRDVVIPPDFPLGRVTLYFPDIGTEMETIYSTLSAPEGTRIMASITASSGNDTARLLSDGDSWTRVPIETASDGEQNVVTVDADSDLGSDAEGNPTGESDPEEPFDICDQLPPESIELMLNLMNQVSEEPVTAGEICEWIRLSGFEPPEMEGRIAARQSDWIPQALQGISALSSPPKIKLRRDVCAAKANKKKKTLVKVDFDLRKISPAVKARGYRIRAGFKSYEYKGSKRATLKPASEGRYRGRPIILMESLGWSGSKERLNIYRFDKKGKLKRKKTFTVPSYVFHRGMRLTRTPVSSEIDGKQATVELTNGKSSYAVCFTMAKKRQYANGYKR
jgi:hypothetical protein